MGATADGTAQGLSPASKIRVTLLPAVLAEGDSDGGIGLADAEDNVAEVEGVPSERPCSGTLLRVPYVKVGEHSVHHLLIGVDPRGTSENKELLEGGLPHAGLGILSSDWRAI